MAPVELKPNRWNDHNQPRGWDGGSESTSIPPIPGTTSRGPVWLVHLLWEQADAGSNPAYSTPTPGLWGL